MILLPINYLMLLASYIFSSKENVTSSDKEKRMQTKNKHRLSNLLPGDLGS